MADETKPAATAPKPVAKDASKDLGPQWSTNENGDLVFNGEFPDQKRIDADRKRVSDELKNSDKYDSEGLADNVSGDASEKTSDHLYSHDPAKRAFPPGPDDPSKA